MKYMLNTVLPLLFMTAMLNAQEPDSTQARQKAQFSKQGDNREFVDSNGNGIDDRVEMDRMNEGKRGNKRRDVFVDKDGDGISDGREGDIMGRENSRHQKKTQGRK